MARLETKNLRVAFGRESEPVLNGVSVRFQEGGMNALVGPSGCGKTTLLRSLLGAVPFEGDCLLDGETMRIPADLAGRIGYVPQFCVAHQHLTVREALADAARLHLKPGRRQAAVEEALDRTQLGGISEQRIGRLSGGQQRRLALALEMVPDPAVYLCDEVTTGLDPSAENAILDLLETLNREKGVTFVNIIHNLAQLPRFARITVLYAGGVVFAGSWEGLKRWFGLDDPVHLYEVLATRPGSVWLERWRKAGDPVDEAQASRRAAHHGGPEAGAPPGTGTDLPPRSRLSPPVPVPSQFLTVLRRRYRLFFRDRGTLALTLAITFGFPILVVIFALDGLPEPGALWAEAAVAGPAGLRERFDDTLTAMENGSLVSALILFQVILLCLIGSNNGAREIAGERDLYEKERLRGLHPVAYIGAKLVFVGSVAIFQGIWMALFVKGVCRFPGDVGQQVAGLVLVTLSMSWACLGFSALLRSEDRASLLSVYLVGFQLPLSGIVLALPPLMVWLFRPLIAAYWGWAVYLSAFREDPLYDAVVRVGGETVPGFFSGVLVLGVLAILGAGLVVSGCLVRRPVS